MLLAVDVGNTNTVLGVYEGTTLARHFRVESSRTRTSDEYGILFRSLFEASGLDVGQIGEAICASVVPPLSDTVVQAIRAYFRVEPMLVGPGLKTGMALLVDNPREVGADRIVNAVAAFERVRGGVIVVDFGTATTADCVSPKGEYLGGVIAPGMVISADALFRAAAKLPRVEFVKPRTALGKNSVHSIQSGIVFGYVGLVDGLVERLKAELGFPCAVLATGGLASVVSSESRTIEATDEFLTLDGLRILFERNR
ncbi:MAG: type III pantothenate kinase [Deltaproteobacteria bacterium]|nr:type III pantothenate kinase [Deltaproteobacteria bacterium]